MAEWTIIKCTICEMLFRVYAYEVRKGDPSCCDECNEQFVEEEQLDITETAE